jgi:hypothetical protein
MTPEAAAELLGVPIGAPRRAIEAAYRTKARATHPDRFVGQPKDIAASATKEFIAVATARDVLLNLEIVTLSTGRPVPRRSPLLLWTWVGILVVAAFLSIYASAFPLGVAEPFVRFAVIIGSLIAYAFTGMRAWMVLAIVALAATAVITIVFTSIGSLLGMLIMVAPVFGLMLMGVETAKHR